MYIIIILAFFFPDYREERSSNVSQSSMVMYCKVKYTDFQLENTNNIISCILYNQFLIDRDSYSDTLDNFYDVAPGQIYKELLNY